jgi:hypothetical protein
MKKFLAKFIPRKTRLVTRDDVTEEDVHKAFSAIPQDSDLWKALHVVIDELLLNGVNEVSDPSNANNAGALAYNAGRIEALSLLKTHLDERRRVSRPRMD